MKRKLKVNDFFCGCGGMGIAFKNAGYEIAGAWDFDKYAVESYRANVGDHVQKADIKELHQADIPQADVWAFGFPCQDLSVAGKQRGMILKCEDCGEEIEINPEEYTGNTICPKCSSNNFKAASRSGCFFEMMRLLEETEREREHAMPAVIIAENVRGLRPYLPVLRLEYERHGYTAHIEMFNSKYWNVPQNRDRYAVVGTRNKKNLTFTFPKEQHEFVPKLSDYLEKDVPEKYYLPDEKAQTIIAQGHQIILWTSRAGADLENAVEWCRLQGLVFDAVNEPLPEQIKRWGNDTRKIYADYYIDDKNMTIAQVESTMNQIKEIMEEIKE